MAESHHLRQEITAPPRRILLLTQRPNAPPPRDSSTAAAAGEGRERLKRHREEVAGRVAIPDNWGQENLLNDWIDYAPFDKLLAPAGLASAREALAAEGRRVCAGGGGGRRLRIESRCC